MKLHKQIQFVNESKVSLTGEVLLWVVALIKAKLKNKEVLLNFLKGIKKYYQEQNQQNISKNLKRNKFLGRMTPFFKKQGHN